MKTKEDTNQLQSEAHYTNGLIVLANFVCVEQRKPAEMMSDFVIGAHTRMGRQMSHIISHTIISASNAVAVNAEIKFFTGEARPFEIQLQKCIPHKATTVRDIFQSGGGSYSEIGYTFRQDV